MDRRTALSKILGRKEEKACTRPTPPNNGLAIYTGPWTFQQAAHLLRRSTFGPTYEQIKWAVEQGLETTVTKLFEGLPLPEPPVNSRYENDPAVPIGSAWANAPYPDDLEERGNVMGYRNLSLYAWTIGLMMEEGVSAREKLTLFWHNHFPINEIIDPKFRYRYIELLRSHAKGNFKDLVKRVTIDPSMLEYLDGKINKKEAPNENYARELLELFTIGKGPQVSPGDYSNFTEQDVREIARALSGWRIYGYGNSINHPSGAFGSEFIPERHDNGIKTLSYRFNNAVINGLGDQEYVYVIDIIFQQPEVARHICRRLYQWFVYYELDEEIEANIIEPMAQILLDNDYEIAPALQALLSSEHFFDSIFFGVMIKNPLDYLMSILKPMRIETSQSLNQQYDSWYALSRFPSLMQMEYFRIPEVAGWKAYYRDPLYYRHWISATTLPVRAHLAKELANSGVSPFQGNGMQMKAGLLKFIETIEGPSNPDSVVEEFTKTLLPKPLADEQYATLKDILLAGLPDFEWTVEYAIYALNPGNSGLASSIEGRLRGLLDAILSMPEFQLT